VTFLPRRSELHSVVLRVKGTHCDVAVLFVCGEMGVDSAAVEMSRRKRERAKMKTERKEEEDGLMTPYRINTLQREEERSGERKLREREKKSGGKRSEEKKTETAEEEKSQKRERGKREKVTRKEEEIFLEREREKKGG